MLSTTDRTPLSRAMAQNSRICGWIDGSPPDGFGFAFGGDERVEARQDLSQREGEPVRLMAGVGEADRAVEVARGVDLDQPDAGVLLVVGAEPAVERTPAVRDGAGHRTHQHRTGTAHRVVIPAGRAGTQPSASSLTRGPVAFDPHAAPDRYAVTDEGGRPVAGLRVRPSRLGVHGATDRDVEIAGCPFHGQAPLWLLGRR